jgi:hypothetical protein
MKEGTFQKLETNPFTNPQTMPTITLTATAAAIATGIGNDSLFSARPATIAHSAITDPTDKSMPPMRITKVIPVAMMRLIVICVSMLVMFDSSVKWGAAAEKTMTSRRSATPIPASCRTR